MLGLFFMTSASIFWNFSSIAAARGFTTMTANAPSRNVIRKAGSMNCQADMPAARATTASFARARRQKVSIAANRVMNGSVDCARNGIFRALI